MDELEAVPGVALGAMLLFGAVVWFSAPHRWRFKKLIFYGFLGVLALIFATGYMRNLLPAVGPGEPLSTWGGCTAELGSRLNPHSRAPWHSTPVRELTQIVDIDQVNPQKVRPTPSWAGRRDLASTVWPTSWESSFIPVTRTPTPGL